MSVYQLNKSTSALSQHASPLPQPMSQSLAPHNPVDLRFFPHSSPHSHWPLRNYLLVTIEVPLASQPTLRTHPPPGHSLTLNKTLDIFTLPAQPSSSTFFTPSYIRCVAGMPKIAPLILFSVVMFLPRLRDVDSARTRADFAILAPGNEFFTPSARWLFADIANSAGMNGQALLARGPSAWISGCGSSAGALYGNATPVIQHGDQDEDI
ncbi:hypothetical protein B0H19DRAFT_1258322 [Mycena capillaripes]|nr:hypothetical protein B0H19DRAFT_1258322 [Mycena capillaripes]